jgi:antirestriction protein ArdC
MRKSNRTTERVSIYDRVTAKIISDLEIGTRPWIKPWTHAVGSSSATRPSRHDGQPYRGINTIILWSEAAERGYQSSCWMTYRQAQILGAHVRKGETATTIVYAGRIAKSDYGVELDGHTHLGARFLKTYGVFNVDQIEGLAEEFTTSTFVRSEPDAAIRIDRADAFITATGAVIRTGASRACYNPSADRIDMPAFGRFFDTATSTAAESYYSTLLHELIHWTSPSGRCDRQLGKRFGDQAYAGEELVAEIGAAFLCAELGVSLQPRPDTAAYIASWLKVIKADNRAIFSAAAFAQRALDWLAATTMIDSGAP